MGCSPHNSGQQQLMRQPMIQDDLGFIPLVTKKQCTPFCYELAKRSLVAAEMQINRIWAPREKPKSLSEFRSAYDPLLVDIHFYFVSIRNINRYLKELTNDELFSCLKDKFIIMENSFFAHFKNGRDALEHMNERLPGNKYANRTKEITENGCTRSVHAGVSLKRGIYYYSDQEWDISDNEFRKMKSQIDNFLQNVLDIAMKEYQKRFPPVQP